MGYFLFLLVTAALFVRPAEIFPAVYAWPIYEWLILACLAMSLPGVLSQLSTKSLAENPITACVLGVWAAVVLSHLAHFDFWSARHFGFQFFKIVVYYLLLVANVNSEERLKSFLRWLLLLIALLAVLALLANYHVIELPGVDFYVERRVDKVTGQMIVIPRLQSTGIFNNPNNLAMILVPGVVIAIYFAVDPAAGLLRPLGLALVGLFGYAIYGTQSRGGLLALLAAFLTLCLARWGWKRTALIAAVCLPVLLVAFHGRMTEFGHAMGEDTGQSRIQLWSSGFVLFKQQPLFGIGFGQYVEKFGTVPHNTFLQFFIESGLLGGGLFLGAFMAAFVMLNGIRDQTDSNESLGLAQLVPCIAAVSAGFVASMLASNRTESVPTYLVLGLVTVLARSATEQTGLPLLRFDPRFIKMMVFGSLVSVTILYVFTRLTVDWSQRMSLIHTHGNNQRVLATISVHTLPLDSQWLDQIKMYNLVRAAEAGWTGSVGDARDFELEALTRLPSPVAGDGQGVRATLVPSPTLGEAQGVAGPAYGADAFLLIALPRGHQEATNGHN